MDRVLHAMSVFTHLARTGSFTAAAGAMGMSVASCSAIIRKLEFHLNVTLLQRSTRSMSLTAEGSLYYAHCLRMLSEIDDMQKLLRGAGKVARGPLSVDIDPEVAPHILPSLVGFHAHYPEVDLRIDIGGRAEGLIENGVDCAVVVGNLADSSLRSRRIASLQAITVASPEYLARRGVPRDIEALRDHDIIHYRPRRFGAARQPRFSAGGSEVEIKLPERICIGDADAVIHYAAKGLGIAQVCRDMSASRRRIGSLVEILQEHRPPPLPITTLYSDRRHAPMSVRAFIDWVSALMQCIGAVQHSPASDDAEISRRLAPFQQPTAAALAHVSPRHAT
ncbi:LysR family transcriptional regulator [Paraburkholderia strydomiana]|uniref:LysR family transcriptional regulator n=1 Tax=Paraburkholderia strydomiana TaxID=1245417 RepID=UPI0038BC842B